MPSSEFSVAIPSDLNAQILAHLIRADRQEDLCFALWAPSRGTGRYSALVNQVILPAPGDRQVHGNVSFNPQYLERVCAIACRAEMGIAFLHSHPGRGWQSMSPDDVAAEKRIASAVEALTELPLVGLTSGSNGTWSARFWQSNQSNSKADRICWCHTVRSVGTSLSVSFNNRVMPVPVFQDLFRRTVTVWGEANHASLARLRIGIVGIGSVGSIVTETLARMGMTRFVLIDFDEVQLHNLDRLLGATKHDIGRLKVDVAARQISRVATAASVEIERVPFSLAEEPGYRSALDCDVLFSCVDRPRARSILNHFAYAHLIPVIDGGIQVRFKVGEFSGADWQLQTVAPGRPCLDCLGAFNPSDVETEKAGLLDDPSYLAGLKRDHRFKSNENVFPFSANLASLEVLQFIALVTGVAGIHDFGVQRFRYVPGHLESDPTRRCRPSCLCGHLTGRGDKDFTLFGEDLAAKAARERQKATQANCFGAALRTVWNRVLKIKDNAQTKIQSIRRQRLAKADGR